MGKRALGIDIGAGSVKLVELEKTPEGIQLVRAKFFDLTQFADQDKRETLIREGIEGLLKAEKIRSCQAAVSLSGQSVFIRFLKLPKIQKNKIDKIIKYEAQQQVPFPLDKITWDHQIFVSASAAEEVVLFVAAKKEIVEATLAYLSRTNLDVELIDVSPLALFNAVTFSEPLKRSIILDIGAKAANLIVIEDKGGLWVRSILIAGDEMTHAIVSKFKLSFDKAEELKRKEGIVIDTEALAASNLSPSAKDLSAVLNPVVSDLASSVIQSLEFYRTKYAHDLPFNEIILSGGGSKLKGIEDFLAKALGMQIRRVNLGQRIKCPSDLRVDIDFQTRFGAAIGLALRLMHKCPTNIDLLPVERKREKDFKKERVWIISLGIAFSLIPLTFTFNIWSHSSVFVKEVQVLEKALDDYKTIKININSLKGKIQKTELKIKPIENFADKRAILMEVFLEVDKLMPDDTWLTSFSVEKNILSLEGNTTSNLLTITEFKKRLASSNFFDSVEIVYASLPKESEEFDAQIRNFSIRCRIKDP